MSYDERQVTRLLPFFYPSSQSTTPDPAAAAASLAEHLKAEPIAAAALAIDLSVFLLHIATARPAHTDHVLRTIQILFETPSLPLTENWSYCPTATLEEMFRVAFQEDIDASIGSPVSVEERELHLAASLLGARARSIGILDTPNIVGSLAEGLGFSDEVLFHYQGDLAEIVATGSCIQLLCGSSSLVQNQPKRFAKDRLLAALDCLKISRIDALIRFTKSHLEKEPLVDLTSEEIADSLILRSNGKEKGNAV